MVEKIKTPIQKLINGKPGEFARRIGCPKSTANHYSDGTRTPPEWVYRLIKNKLIVDDNKCSRCGGSGKTQTKSFDITRSGDNHTTIELFNEKCKDCSGIGHFKHIYIFDVEKLTLDGACLLSHRYASYNIRAQSVMSFSLENGSELTLAGGQIRVINIPEETK